MSSTPLGRRWLAAARLLAGARDVLLARPGAAGPGDDEGDKGMPPARLEAGDADAALSVPAALARRGWSEFLLALDDAALEALEVGGVDAPLPAGAPDGLRALVSQARAACALDALGSIDGLDAPASRPALPGAPPPLDGAPRRAEKPRKHAQVAAYAQLAAPLASRAARVLDVGSGHGHLTRAIAEAIARPVLGLERDPRLAERARRLTAAEASPRADASPTFALTDVVEGGLALSSADCVLGLHACGELGDVMVTSVARAPGATLVLVGCCPQKRRAPSRSPLHVPDATDADAAERDALARALDLPRPLLGLANLAAGELGVESSRPLNLLARERRLALHHLLSTHASDSSDAPTPVALRLGAEIEGLNRRAAHRALPELVALAFAARRLPPPPASAVARAAAWARTAHARARRLSIPRALLARALEVFLLLDRAAYLEARGKQVRVGVLFPARVSPRNLALVASIP